MKWVFVIAVICAVLSALSCAVSHNVSGMLGWIAAVMWQGVYYIERYV
jgi:hypothetical protein